jgi:hypothetical protein
MTGREGSARLVALIAPMIAAPTSMRQSSLGLDEL